MGLLILCTIHHHVPAKNWLDEVSATWEDPPGPSPAQPSPGLLLKDEGLQFILLGASEAPGQVLQIQETCSRPSGHRRGNRWGQGGVGAYREGTLEPRLLGGGEDT